MLHLNQVPLLTVLIAQVEVVPTSAGTTILASDKNRSLLMLLKLASMSPFDFDCW
jgi:hypothetical protein